MACRHHHDRPVNAVPPQGLDSAVEQQARVATPDGPLVGQIMRGYGGDDDDKKDFTIALDAKHCYWFSGVGDQGVEKLSLYLWDPNDKRVESKRAGTPQALMRYCPTMPGPYRLQGKVGDGAGYFAIGVYAAERDAAPPPPPAEEKPDLEALIQQQASAAASGATRVGNYFEGSADQTDWSIPMQPGKCYWVIGAGEPGKIKKLWLYLWDPQNHRITENKAQSNTVMVGHCPTQPGMYKFQAKVDSGSGNYKVGVFEKKN